MPKRGKKRRLEGPSPDPSPVSDGGVGGDAVPAAPEGPHSKFSNLATHLLKAWTWGLETATEVQRVAHAAFKDGLKHPEIQKLAQLGQWGNYPGNIHDQLRRMLGKSKLPEPLDFDVPCLDPKTSTITEATCSVLLPHEWFSSLYHEYPAEFEDLFAPNGLEEFWSKASRIRFFGFARVHSDA